MGSEMCIRDSSNAASEANGAFAVTTGDIDGDSVEDVIVAANIADAFGWYRVGGVLSVEDNILASDIIVYPNPASEVIHIQNKSNAPIQQIKLIDMLGKQYEVPLEVSNTVSLQTFATGIYQLRIVTPQGTAQYKIIKR